VQSICHSIGRIKIDPSSSEVEAGRNRAIRRSDLDFFSASFEKRPFEPIDSSSLIVPLAHPHPKTFRWRLGHYPFRHDVENSRIGVLCTSVREARTKRETWMNQKILDANIRFIRKCSKEWRSNKDFASKTGLTENIVEQFSSGRTPIGDKHIVAIEKAFDLRREALSLPSDQFEKYFPNRHEELFLRQLRALVARCVASDRWPNRARQLPRRS
jgi:hypothetical protein